MNKTQSHITLDYDNDKHIVNFVEGIWSNKDYYKGHLEPIWYRNLAWFLGHQNIIWNEDYRRFFKAGASDNRVRMVVNLLRSAIRHNHSKLGTNEPIWFPVPATDSNTDLERTELAKILLQHEWDKNKMSRKDPKLDMWTLITGNSFSKTTWDADKGPLVTIKIEDEEQETQEVITETLPIGDTRVEIVSPFEMILPNGHEIFEDCPWCMQTQVKDIHELRVEFEAAKDITHDKSINMGSGFNHQNFLQKIHNVTQRFGGYFSAGNSIKDQEHLIYVHEFWVKPQPGLEDGRYVVVAGGKVLHNVIFPYAHKKLPYQHRGEIDTSGRVWCSSTLEDLIPIQGEYNKTKSQLIEARELMANPKWAVPVGSVDNKRAINNRAGEIIEYTGLPPEVITPPNMPAYVVNMIQQNRVDFEDVSGQHEVSRAEAPGQVRSGSGISLLLQQDETRLRPVKKLKELAQGEMGSQLLSLLAQFVTEQRLARVVGDNNELILKNFMGPDLVGDEAFKPGIEYFDVRVISTSQLPSTPEAQRQLAIDLTGTGVLNPQDEKDKIKLSSLLNFGNTLDRLDDSGQHRAMQTHEINKMLEGEPAQVKRYHNHIVHMEALTKFMNSAEFLDLKPQIQQILEKHLDDHETNMAMNQVEPAIRQQVAVQRLSQQLGLVPQGPSGPSSQAAPTGQGANNGR